MDTLKFTKVVGSGNDFIIIDNRTKNLETVLKNFSQFSKSVCRRKVAVGGDGVLVLEDSDKADFRMRIFNPDGSEVAMCGNGARCSALYAAINKWCAHNMRIATGAGIIEAAVKGNSVKLRVTDPKDITLNKDIGVDKTIFKAHFINTGVPHVVHFLEGIDEYPVREIGAKIRYHKVFKPEGTNANFVKVLTDNSIKVRTYERGVEDETAACGTGSVASAIISHLVHGTRQPVEVLTSSGETLKIYFNVKNDKISDVHLEGTAEIVYKGELVLRSFKGGG